jgi:hypothetical protein
MAFKPWDDIRIEWRGSEYVIPSNRVMGLIRRLERVEDITAHDLAMGAQRGKYEMLASAYACALRYTGLSVSTEEVYAEIFPGGKDAADKYKRAIVFANGLIEIITPPDTMREIEEMSKELEGLPEDIADAKIAEHVAGKSKGESNGRTRDAASSSSEKPSKRLRNGESVPISSGNSTQRSSGG